MTPPPLDPETADWKRAYRDLQGAGSEACPPAETLAALAVNELPPNERDRVADHSVACRRCAADLQVLMQTDAEAAGANRAASRAPMRLFVMAAAVVLLGVAGVLLTRRPPAVQDVVRGTLPAGIQVTPGNGAELNGAPERFEWPAQQDADGYRVKLFDSSGEALWQSERVSRPNVGLPPLQRSLLKNGQAYYWTVEVEGPTGKTRIGPFPFSMRHP